MKESEDERKELEDWRKEKIWCVIYTFQVIGFGLKTTIGRWWWWSEKRIKGFRSMYVCTYVFLDRKAVHEDWIGCMVHMYCKNTSIYRYNLSFWSWSSWISTFWRVERTLNSQRILHEVWWVFFSRSSTNKRLLMDE